jgi:hypothetical protein
MIARACTGTGNKASLQKPLEYCDTRLQVTTPKPENSEDSALQHFTFSLTKRVGEYVLWPDGKGFNILYERVITPLFDIH